MNEFFSALINIIVTLVDGYTKNAGLQKLFGKQGEIENQVVTQMQQKYSALEDSLGQAAVQQYQDNVTEKAKQEVVTGSLISLAVAIVVIVIVIAAFVVLTGKSKK